MATPQASVHLWEAITTEEIESLMTVEFFDAWLHAEKVMVANEARLRGLCRVDGDIAKWAAFAWCPMGIWRGIGETPAAAVNDLTRMVETFDPREP